MRLFVSRLVVFVYILTLIFYILDKSDLVSNIGEKFYFVQLISYSFLFFLSIKRLFKEKTLITLFIIEIFLLFMIVNYRGTLAGAGLVPFLLINFQILIPYGVTLKDKDNSIILFIFVCLLLFASQLLGTTINGNNLGFIFVCIGIYLILLIPTTRKIYYWIILLFSFILITFLLKSESRSALGAFILFLIGKFMPLSYFKSKNIYKIIGLFLTFGSMLYIYIYLNLYNKNLYTEQSFQFMHSSKSLFSGREIIWDNALILLNENPFTGVGGIYELRYSNLNELHNFVLNIYFYYGYILGTFMLLLINRLLFEICNYIDKNQRIKDALVGFWAFLFVGLNEVSMFAYSIGYLTLLLAYNEINKYNKRVL